MAEQAKGPGLFHWRWRLGRFENAAQVANWIHRRYGRTPDQAWRLVEGVQRQHQGRRTDPAVIWREVKKQLRGRR